MIARANTFARHNGVREPHLEDIVKHTHSDAILKCNARVNKSQWRTWHRAMHTVRFCPLSALMRAAIW